MRQISLLLSAVGLSLYTLHTLSTTYIVCSPKNRIYTVNPAQPEAQCFSVNKDRIQRVGSYDDVAAFHITIPIIDVKWRIERPRTMFLDPTDIVVPGLADAHAHILENGWMTQLPLVGSASIQEVVDRIKSYIYAHPDILQDRDRWIEGMGWDQTKWSDNKFPTAEDLDHDPLLRGRPISLSRVDGHARWVSARVLSLMGTVPQDDEIVGGQIIRDVDGKPTGVFVDNAMNLIPIPAWTEQQMEDYFLTTMKMALEYGLTSIHDADTKLHMIEFFKRKAKQGEVPIRLYLMGGVALPDSNAFNDTAQFGSFIQNDWGHNIPRFVEYGKHKRLTLRSVKLFADGALGSWGAALLEPYSDNPSISGTLLQPQEVLKAAIYRYWKDNMQVNVHCIGDMANRVTLDIFDTLESNQGADFSELRPRIEHAQIISLEDIGRFGSLGVIPSVQPTHATSDMWYAEKRLGPERIRGAYAYATLHRTSKHGILPLGSDFPIEGVNPLLGFYAAVLRRAVDGNSPHGSSGWYEEERLTRKQALKGMTLDAAYASFNEHEIGSLEVGKKADFVVFDRDFVVCDTCNGSEILNAKTRVVVVDGTAAWGKLPEWKALGVFREAYDVAITWWYDRGFW